jgi:hypothetical protein
MNSEHHTGEGVWGIESFRYSLVAGMISLGRYIPHIYVSGFDEHLYTEFWYEK